MEENKQVCSLCGEELHDFKGYWVHGSAAMLERCLQIKYFQKAYGEILPKIQK